MLELNRDSRLNPDSIWIQFGDSLDKSNPLKCLKFQFHCRKIEILKKIFGLDPCLDYIPYHQITFPWLTTRWVGLWQVNYQVVYYPKWEWHYNSILFFFG